MLSFYKPSGQFSPISIIFLIVVSLVIFPILGLLYAYAIWYIPLIYFNFIIAGGLGFLIGRIISWGPIKKGKVRNIPIAIAFGIFGGLCAMYFHWAAWVDLVLNISDTIGNDRIGVAVSNVKLDQLIGLITHPSELFAIIGEINQYGTWGFKGNVVSGTFLTIIWIIEFILILGATVLFSFKTAGSPFSESLNEWNEEKPTKIFGFIDDINPIITGLVSDDITPFENIIEANPQGNHSFLTLFHIDGDDSYLTVTNRIAKTDDKGKLDFDDVELLEYAAVKPAVQDYLLGR